MVDGNCVYTELENNMVDGKKGIPDPSRSAGYGAIPWIFPTGTCLVMLLPWVWIADLTCLPDA